MIWFLPLQKEPVHTDCSTSHPERLKDSKKYTFIKSRNCVKNSFVIKIFSDFLNVTPSPEKQVSKTVLGNSSLKCNMEMALSAFTTGGLKDKQRKGKEHINIQKKND